MRLSSNIASPQLARILIYGINYAPELTGIGKYSGDLGSWLAGRGHEVRVIAAPPYYPEWVVGSGHKAFLYRNEMLSKALVLRAPLWIPKNQRTLNRLIHLLSFAVSSAPIALYQAAWKPQVILSVAPTMFTAPAALLLKRLSRSKAVIHFQDFEVDAAFGLGMMRFSFAERLARGIEKRLISRFDRVSTISKRMEQRLWEKGVPASKTLLFPNWVDCQAIFPMPRAENGFRKEFGIPGHVKVVMYSGAMGEKQGLELVVAAAQKLGARSDVLFVLAGSGAARNRLEAQTQGTANVRWLPLQPESALNAWLNFADVHLLPQRAGAADMVMPSKLTGMLASGRPVVCTAEPGTQLAKVVGQQLGIVTPPESADAFADAIVRLCDDEALRADLGANARRYAVEHYDRVNVLTRFESELLSLAAETGSTADDRKK